MDILRYIALICCIGALGLKIAQKKPFEDWAWPLIAFWWCLNTMK
jgi:hypothetical protein